MNCPVCHANVDPSTGVCPACGNPLNYYPQQGQPQYQAQPRYQGQPQYQAQPQYQGQYQYQGQPQYPNQPPYPGEPAKAAKKSKKLPIIISLIGVVLVGVGLLLFFLLRGGSTGYKSINEAAEKDRQLLEKGNWDEILDSVSSDDWDRIYTRYQYDLKTASDINSVSELKDKVREEAKTTGNEKGITSVRIDGSPRYEDDIDDIWELDPTVRTAYYVEMEVVTRDGTTMHDEVYYALKDDKYYSMLGITLAYAITDTLSVGPKTKDISAAETVNTAVQTSLANEDAYDEIMNYMDGRILATANAGEPFRAEGGLSLNYFLSEVNANLGGKTPELKYRGPVNGWTPKGWAVGVQNGKPIVYITDGTSYNKVELQPSIDQNYK